MRKVVKTCSQDHLNVGDLSSNDANNSTLVQAGLDIPSTLWLPPLTELLDSEIQAPSPTESHVIKIQEERAERLAKKQANKTTNAKK